MSGDEKEEFLKNYENKKNELRKKEEEFQKSLDDLRKDYIINSNDYTNTLLDEIECENICEGFLFYIIFFALSIAHFILIAEIQSILFSLERDIYRTFYFELHEKYDKEDKKDFDYYLKDSSRHDTSQINFNYLTSFITDLIVSKTNISITYLIAVLGIIITLLGVKSFNFLPRELIEKGENYSGLKITYLILLLVSLYISTSIIS